MWLERLSVENFRCHEALTLHPQSSPWVVLAGANGSGKTSLMEAIYATARGRSFRRVTGTEVIRIGSDHATVVLDSTGEYPHRLGTRYERNHRITKLDGENIQGLAQISAAIPVDYMGGQAHRLVDGSPAERRGFLDWCLFHVEPRFLDVWRLWHRAHRQRNEWLRRGDYPTSSGWTDEVAKYGEQVSAMRADLTSAMDHGLRATTWAKVGEAWPTLTFRRGWPEGGLREALRETADREQRAGRAVVGPQQDDWVLTCNDMKPGLLSRGQTKLASFYLWSVRSKIMRKAGRSAILLADDFMADLDNYALQLALKALQDTSGQVWIAVQEGAVNIELPGEAARFHVEHA